MIDSMFQEGTDAALDDQVTRPRPEPASSPAFNLLGVGTAPFRGIGGGVAKSMAFGAEVVGAFGQAVRALDQATPEQRRKNDRRGLPAPDMSNEVGDALRQRAADILPDPKTAHESEQIVAGLADFATRAIGYTVTLGPLAPFAMGGDAALEEADRLKQQGVDKETRTKAGAVAGVLNAAAVAIPMHGATALTRFGKGVAVGEGTIVGQSLAEREILRAAGYDRQAESFDPLDPVALALGVVPGALGARFGKPKLRTEADVRRAAQFTPEEQARSDAYERSPTNLRELERAIKDEKRPEVRALLEAEYAKQSRAAAEHGIDAAVRAEPDLEPAARVRQVAQALDDTRLTPDVDLAGRDAHVSAVELAADQMGRGEPVEVARVVRRPEIALADEITGSANGQTNGTLRARIGGREAGYLDYTVYDGVPQISMVEVLPEMRRQGVGAELVKQLQRKFPDTEIDWGMMTDDGAALRASLPKIEREVSTVRAKLGELEKALAERGVLERKAAEFDAIAAPTEQQRQAHRGWIAKVGDRWNELHDRIDTLETELRGAKPTRTMIDTTDRPTQLAAATEKLRAARPQPEPAAGMPSRAEVRAAEAARPDTSRQPAKSAPAKEKSAAAPDSGSPENRAPSAAARAADEAAALNPDMLVQLEGMDAPMRVGDLMAKVKEEARQDTLMGKLVEVAAACDLTA